MTTKDKRRMLLEVQVLKLEFEKKLRNVTKICFMLGTQSFGAIHESEIFEISKMKRFISQDEIIEISMEETDVFTYDFKIYDADKVAYKLLGDGKLEGKWSQSKTPTTIQINSTKGRGVLATAVLETRCLNQDCTDILNKPQENDSSSNDSYDDDNSIDNDNSIDTSADRHDAADSGDCHDEVALRKLFGQIYRQDPVALEKNLSLLIDEFSTDVNTVRFEDTFQFIAVHNEPWFQDLSRRSSDECLHIEYRSFPPRAYLYRPKHSVVSENPKAIADNANTEPNPEKQIISHYKPMLDTLEWCTNSDNNDMKADSMEHVKLVLRCIGAKSSASAHVPTI